MDNKHGTIPKTMELRFTKDKTQQITTNYENLIYKKNMVIIYLDN